MLQKQANKKVEMNKKMFKEFLFYIVIFNI